MSVIDAAERDRLATVAFELSADHLAMKAELVRLRKESGLSQLEVAGRMGIYLSAVAEFERYSSDPTLSMVERYALAVHARVITTVRPCAFD